MAKIMLVTYNAIPGIPIGRHFLGDVVVYSGDYGRDTFMREIFVPNEVVEQAINAAEKKLAEIKKALEVDVQDITEAYIYVGVGALKGAIELIRNLKAKGKIVRMVACSCEIETKRQLARELGINWIESECGGRDTCANIIRKLTAQSSSN